MTPREALDRTVLLCRDFVRADEASDDEVVHALTTTCVTIVADEPNLATAAAQALVVALAGQVLGYGCRLRLAMPEVELVGFQPPIQSRSLRQGIVDLASDLIPGGAGEIVGHPEPNDFVFVVGSTPCTRRAHRTWRLGGSRWTGMMAGIDARVPTWPDNFPIGALVAATCAAAEPFKGAVHDLLSRVGAGTRHVELQPCPSTSVTLGPEELVRPSLDLDRLDIVSGGAITNGVLHALLRLPATTGAVRIFEPETLDLSNLNRYALARRSQVGLFKVDALKTWQLPKLTIEGLTARFDDDLLETVRPLAPRIIVGTDEIPPRWLAQRQHPKWLGIGATAHFLAVASEHRLGDPCGGCLHSEDDDVRAAIPTVSFVSYWAGLLVVARLVRAIWEQRGDPEHQVAEVACLRLDGPHGIWWHRVHRIPDCPVRCDALAL